MKLKEFINNDYKNRRRLLENFFFVGTIFVIIANLLLFAVGGDFRSAISIDYLWHWSDTLYFNRLARSFLNSFAHFNTQHAVLNMLCFSVCGIYLERKTGSIKFVLLVLVTAFFTSAAVSANDMSLNWTGFSGVNYGLYFYIAVDYLFSLQQSKRQQQNAILGGIVLGLIYIFMCFSGGTSSFSFKVYPYDLATNLGHYSSAVAGLILGLTVQISHIKTSNA